MSAKLYGCFRCGEIDGEVHVNEDTDRLVCGSCGEQSIVSFVTALDILNDLYLKGEWRLSGDEEEIDYEEE